MTLTCRRPKGKHAPTPRLPHCFSCGRNLSSKFRFLCVRGRGKRGTSPLAHKASHAEGLVFTALLGTPCSGTSHQALHSICSRVVPQTGYRKREKADRCCFSAFRVLVATGATRFEYHRCFPTGAKMVKLEGETEPQYAQRREIRGGAVWAS